MRSTCFFIGPGTNLDCLEIVGVGSSPVKKESFEYLQNRVKKDLFIVSLYGKIPCIFL